MDNAMDLSLGATEELSNNELQSELPDNYLDVSDEYLELFGSIISVGDNTLTELNDIIEYWKQEFFTGRNSSSIYQIEYLRESIDRFTLKVEPYLPAVPKTYYEHLMIAVEQAVKSISISLTSIANAMRERDVSLLYESLDCAKKGVEVLHIVNDSINNINITADPYEQY